MTISERNWPVAERAAKIIENQGIKQCVVAERAGYSAQSMNDMLNGRRLIRPIDVVKIAKALNITPDKLFAKINEGVS